MPDNPFHEGAFPDVQPKPLLTQLEAVFSCFPPGADNGEPSAVRVYRYQQNPHQGSLQLLRDSQRARAGSQLRGLCSLAEQRGGGSLCPSLCLRRDLCPKAASS